MAYLRRLNVVLSKVEGTYGTDPVPVVGTDAVLTSMPEITFDGERLDRNLVKNTFSQMGPAIGGKTIGISFEAELKGSGAAGTAPKFGPLLKACGLSETIVASTSVTYAPMSDDHYSCTIYTYIHDLLFKILGCRGTCEFVCNAGNHGIIRFNMTGLYAAPTDGTLPASVTYSAVSPPILESAAMTINDVAKVVSGVTLSLNNNVVKRRSLSGVGGMASIEIIGRTINGTIDPEAETVAGKNYWTEWTGHTKQEIELVIGSAGNKYTLNAAKAQFGGLGIGDKDGIFVLNMPFDCVQTTGDDEFFLKFE